MAATRERSVVRVVLVLAAAGFAALPAHAKYGGGSGTAKDPWRIATKADLLALAAATQDYSAHFVLTADLDLSKQTFTMAVIAPSPQAGEHGKFTGTPFTGTFDGRGHKITGLTIDGSRSHGYLGLFGCVARGGLVKNLRLERASIIDGSITQHVGMLVGLNDGGTLTNCSVAGSVTCSGGSQIGALAGANGAGGTISGCQAITGTTHGGSEVGGLVGANAPGARITDCSAGGTLSGGTQWVGGLVGHNRGTIARCQATGDIAPNGDWDLGGLVGWNRGIVIHCRSTGSVAGRSHSHDLGGLAGRNDGTIIDCHATGGVTGERPASSFGGLAGKNLGFISHCCATGSIAGASDSGGLVGYNRGIITECYATGNVTGGARAGWGGGLIGNNEVPSTIMNCYAIGSTADFSIIGGLAGDNTGTITNCYAAGNVTGSTPNVAVGGLIGTASAPGQTIGSYWDTQTSGQSRSAGGTGKTTAQMKTAKTFLDGGWDFNCIWDIVEHETYPFLRFNPAADLTCDGKVSLWDFAKLAANWSKTCSTATNPKLPLPKCPLAGDLNYDKTVDAKDLMLLAVQWLDRREPVAGR